MDSVIQATDDIQAIDELAPEVGAALTAVLEGAVDTARAAIEEFSGVDSVGDYLGATAEDAEVIASSAEPGAAGRRYGAEVIASSAEPGAAGRRYGNAATHRFNAILSGYGGWQWAVVVAAYPGATRATISEVVLVPGPDALLAPEWVPWDQRVRPGDLGPGDLLAPPADDPRLVPGYVSSGDDELDELAGEIGLGRRQVLSAWGRADAAQRWHDGDFGPQSAMARSTKRACKDCGYLLPLAGSLGTMFGVCANEMSGDGHVVDFGYGCGAHSDTPAPSGSGSPLYDPYDDGVLEVMRVEAVAPASGDEAVAQPPAAGEAVAAAEAAESVTADVEEARPAEVASTAEESPAAEAPAIADESPAAEAPATTEESPAAELPPTTEETQPAEITAVAEDDSVV